MQIFNLYTCNHCNRQVIHEELETHQCKPLKKYKIEGNTLLISDGQTWYPLKLKAKTANFGINRNFTGRRSTDDYTEPFLGHW